MCSTLNGVDVVDKRIDVLFIGVVVGHGDLNRNVVFGVLNVDNVADERSLALVEIFHKFVKTSL